MHFYWWNILLFPNIYIHQYITKIAYTIRVMNENCDDIVAKKVIL